MDPTSLALLCAAVLLGFSIQSALGFGGGILSLSLAALWMPVQDAVPLIGPLSIVQSVALLVREHEHVAWRSLLRIIAPTMGVGFAVGLWLAGQLEGYDVALRRTYGVVVLLLAVQGLWPSPAADDAAPPRRLAGALGSLAAGVVHGLFATGGPPLAWAAHCLRLRKDAFRTTLLGTFLAVNTVMVVVFVASGRLRDEHVVPLGTLAAVVLLAVPLGRALARRAPEAAFRRAVYGLLLLMGLSLLR
jgi:uncharacterized membrane protein YfcA